MSTEEKKPVPINPVEFLPKEKDPNKWSEGDFKGALIASTYATLELVTKIDKRLTEIEQTLEGVPSAEHVECPWGYPDDPSDVCRDIKDIERRTRQLERHDQRC